MKYKVVFTLTGSVGATTREYLIDSHDINKVLDLLAIKMRLSQELENCKSLIISITEQ